MLGYARILQSSRGDLYENPLRVGEVVRLRSGGPAMTVTGADEAEVAVVWVNTGGQVQAEKFQPELLERGKARRSFFARWR